MVATVRLDGSDATVAELRGIASRTQNALPMWNGIGAFLVGTTVQRFQEEKTPEGSVWPKSLRAKFDGGKTLTDTGRLVGSNQHNPFPTGVEIGSDIVFAAVHQFGATIRAKTEKGLHWRYGAGKKQHAVKKEVTIPARPFLGLSLSDREGILTIAGNWLKGQANVG